MIELYWKPLKEENGTRMYQLEKNVVFFSLPLDVYVFDHGQDDHGKDNGLVVKLQSRRKTPVFCRSHDEEEVRAVRREFACEYLRKYGVTPQMLSTAGLQELKEGKDVFRHKISAFVASYFPESQRAKHA